ncbi:MAG TPA: hypothetical protein VGB79_04560 [Allosphingosinicella sp.]|jgi:hypothetical protein
MSRNRLCERRVLRRLGHLLELNADLDRNASDTRFSGKSTPEVNFEGRNYYVFDENVFELFIQPLESWQYCSNFYGPPWEADENDRDARKYSAQAGLIAAEYLFSGAIPGLPPDAPIYMTEWHYKELKLRLYRRRRVLTQLARKKLNVEQEAERYVEEFQSAVYLGAGNSSADQLARALNGASSDTIDDAKRFMSIVDEPTAVVRFIFARELAQRLVDDKVLEPLEQLDRVYAEVMARVRPLSSRFVAEKGDKGAIRQLIKEWQETLEEGHRDKRKPGRLDYDAKSLAFIHWIARRRLMRDERIIFVTGDAPLYEVYSKWYLERRSEEAFLIRRVNQFSPLINPHDTPNDIQTGDEAGYQLFASTRRAMEAPLVTFNLKRWKEQDEGRAFLAGMLTQEAKPETTMAIQFFTRNLTAAWWEQRDKTFEELRDEWREAERLAIGASLPVLARRLDRRRAFLHQLSAARDAGAAFSEYLEQLLDGIAQKGIRLDFPDAIKFVVEGLRSNLPIVARTPLDVRLRIPSSEGGRPREYNLTEIIDRWLEGDRKILSLLDPSRNERLLDRLDIIYGVAAALALRSEKWIDADRFADHAVAAAEMGTSLGTAAAEETRLECLYLSAVTKRFIIACNSPAEELSNEDIWLENLEQAVFTLSQIECGLKSDAQLRLAFRVLSERVAVRLYHLAWKAVIPAHELDQSGYDPVLRGDHYRSALRDIEDGLERLEGRKSKNAQPGLQPLVLNAAAFAIVHKLLAKQMPELPAPSDTSVRSIEKHVEVAAADLSSYPPIVAVVAYAFLWLVKSQPGAREPLKAALHQKFALALDVAFVARLKQELSRNRRM